MVDREKLMRAVELLNEADALVQQALGATDVCYETHNRIQDVIDDLNCDIEEAA